jgi:uncharacterized protein (DUF433 family)
LRLLPPEGGVPGADIMACLAYAAWLTRERAIELQPT